jgi:uncharacterized protein with PIN domain
MGTTTVKIANVPDMQHMLKLNVDTQNQSLLARMAAAQAARKAIPPPPAPPIASAVFAQHMQAMNLHYSSGPGVKGTVIYALPPQLLHLPVASVTAVAFTLKGAQAVDQVIQQTHAETLAAVKSHAEDLAAAAEQAEQKKISTAQFTQQMNALRARDKQRAQAQIDQWYARLVAVGNAHADQRARVLDAANHGGSFFGRLVGDIEQVTGEVEKGVGGAVQHVTQWASGAVQSVGKFFSSLF